MSKMKSLTSKQLINLSVCETAEGQEMTIWNSTTSEFASGQEYVQIFR